MLIWGGGVEGGVQGGGFGGWDGEMGGEGELQPFGGILGGHGGRSCGCRWRWMIGGGRERIV